MAEQRELFDVGARKPPSKARGYYRRPGSGPKGETCGTCRHIVRVDQDATRGYHKCARIRKLWTSSVRTDVLLRSPACEGWENREVADAAGLNCPLRKAAQAKERDDAESD